MIRQGRIWSTVIVLLVIRQDNQDYAEYGIVATCVRNIEWKKWQYDYRDKWQYDYSDKRQCGYSDKRQYGYRHQW